MAEPTKPPINEHQIEKLNHELESLNTNVASLDDNVASSNKSQRPGPTFARGVIGALGAAVGATLVLAALIYILQALSGVPIIGHIFDTIVHQITQTK
jgi:hypothetical protein